MRKYQQKLLLDTVRSIEEGQSGGDYPNCFRAAAGVSDIINNAVGEGTQTVALLEEYCALIEKASQGDAGKKALRKQLIKIENSIKSEFKPDRIEVVFLPYSPSKWDSLESIYLAAKADPQCDAYVVPIPYYELNPDETFGALHYDGDKFPPDIPITYWEDYDTEEIHPDIIFTHYAYDSNSSNINIHPDFYGERLKEHCELLVHVPYFVEIGENVTEYYGHLPGILHADYVIVQSENVKEAYTKQHNDYIRERRLEGKYKKAKDKFIALGSPKIDKVVNSKKEDFELPPEWEKRIFGETANTCHCGLDPQSPETKRKKVILYNTHTWRWIEGGDLYFNKLKSVFDTFKNRDDAVLWWRPHPNMEVNVRTKRPEMLAKYYKTVSDYKIDGIGIYDDTPDLHRAIAWSDAYYGDWSSLVLLYRFTGKPLMIQNLDVATKEKYPLFTCVCDDGQHFWFTERNINALFKVDKETMTAEFAGELPMGDEPFDVNKTPLYHRAAITNDHIYFPPMHAKEICAYSIKDKVFRTIPYHNNEESAYIQRAFGNAVSYNEFIYFTPCMHPSIVRLNTATDEIEHFSDWLAPLKKIIIKNDNPYFFNSICVGNSIMFAAYSANAVVEFDVTTLTSAIHIVGAKGNCYNGICFDGNSYWLSPRYNAPVIRWDKETGETAEYKVLDDDDEYKRPPFRPVIHCGDYVWLLPNTAKHAIKINVHTYDVVEAKEFEPDYQIKGVDPGTYYHCAFTSGGSIFAYNAKSGCIIEYNCKTNRQKTASLCYPSDAIKQLQPLINKAILADSKSLKSELDCYHYENNITGINDLIKCLSNQDNLKNNTASARKRADIALRNYSNADGTAGAKIYKHFKSEILG